MLQPEHDISVAGSADVLPQQDADAAAEQSDGRGLAITTACKRSLSLGCVAHTDGGVIRTPQLPGDYGTDRNGAQYYRTPRQSYIDQMMYYEAKMLSTFADGIYYDNM